MTQVACQATQAATIFLAGIGLMRHLRLQDLHKTFQAVASVHGT